MDTLPNYNRYGESHFDKEVVMNAMAELGLDHTGQWQNSSLLRFRGTIDGIQVEFKAYMLWSPLNNRLFTKDLNKCTYFKMSSWVPSNVHLRGKGSRNKAWEIYQKILDVLVHYYEISQTEDGDIPGDFGTHQYHDVG